MREAANMDYLAIVLVILAAVAAVTLWSLLLHWIFTMAKPRFERWLWRRLGGEGDPPD
jgi:uncharacterized membrane protein YbaN (DUF454 family)